MNNYKILKISEVSIDQLSEFYKKVFPSRYRILSKNWRWWYRVDCFDYEPLVIIFENKVIGQAGLISVKLRIDDAIVPATWFVDFAILPEHQGKGLGHKITIEWMKICPNQITFCNKKSLKIFKDLGWSSINNTKRFVKLINYTKFFPVIKKYELTSLNRLINFFDTKRFSKAELIKPFQLKNNYKQILDSFLAIKKHDTKFAEIYRDESWFNWRLLECPFNENIHFFEYKQNFAIVSVYMSNKIKRLNILFTYFLDSSNQEELFCSIIKWALSNKIDLIWSNTNNDELIKKFEKVFTKKFYKSMDFASWSSNAKSKEILKFGLKNIQAIDGDNDLSYIEDYSL
tara:strand:+ start:601 stop:1632 length:1032 start_codon:yes stop_codon:yes gene_type:complete